MSIQTWKREFVGPVSKAARSDRAAIEHAIKKYGGLFNNNLWKHWVRWVRWEQELVDGRGNSFDFNCDTCALCHRHRMVGDKDEVCCGTCPLFAVGECCVVDDSAYYKTMATGDPRRMLKALRKSLRALK